ncbi:MAG: hydrolase, partial [Rhodococcus sp. (in: high G+C Gram-positive bacteria)]
MLTITALTPPESFAATTPSTSAPLRVGLVQHRWHEDQGDLYTELSEGIAAAAKLGASVVFLPELTLSRYPASSPADDNPGRQAEDLL